MNLCDDLKMFHHRLNNKDSSLFYDRARLEAAISFRSNQYEVNTKMVEALYTQKVNEQTIKEQKVTLQNELLEKQAINRERGYLILTITLIGLILLIIFFYAYKQQRLKNSLFLENQENELKNQQLSQALEANEALVQEISHRVKNNLAVLSGLLTMQANRSGNEKVIKELKDSVLRIESIATIHKKLYDKRSDAQVSLREAILELNNNVLSAMGIDPETCLETEIDICEIDIAEAVTLCLILNEVLTNSCKYANLSEESKLIVKLKNDKDKITCNVIDHGEGFDENKVTTKSKSLGLYLIRLLAKQLGAVISWEKKKKEFIFSIVLKKDE
jgi:two-component sensor histidine kinase